MSRIKLQNSFGDLYIGLQDVCCRTQTKVAIITELKRKSIS